MLIAPAGCTLDVIIDVESPLELADRVAEHSPNLVILSHLPPGGLTQARYLVKRLRARFARLTIVVGRWSEKGGAATASERLIAVGANHVVFTLVDARARILAAMTRGEPGGLSSKVSAGVPSRRPIEIIPS